MKDFHFHGFILFQVLNFNIKLLQKVIKVELTNFKYKLFRRKQKEERALFHLVLSWSDLRESVNAFIFS